MESQQHSQSVLREPDEIVAPLVFLYVFAVLLWIGAVFAWTFWYRGYA